MKIDADALRVLRRVKDKAPGILAKVAAEIEQAEFAEDPVLDLTQWVDTVMYAKVILQSALDMVGDRIGENRKELESAVGFHANIGEESDDVA